MYKTSILNQKKAMLLIIAFVLMGMPSFAQQWAGNTTPRTIGASGNYSTLKAAIAALTSAGLTAASDGDVILELQADYDPATEFTVAGSIIIGNITNSSEQNQLIIRPAAGVTKEIITSFANDFQGLITFNGTSYVTIDGRRAGQGGMENIGLTITNTNTATPTISAVRISNGRNKTVTFTKLKSATTGSGGVVFFSGTASDNTISYNEISAVNPSVGVKYGIYNNGTANSNNNNRILNNNIFDFNTAAIGLFTGIGTGMQVKENSIYTSTTLTATAYGIYILNANAPSGIIKNNFIGGQAPLCAGAAMSVAAQFYGIATATPDNTVGVADLNIEGNTIANISSSSGILRGISLSFTGAGTTLTGTYNIQGNKIYQLRKTNTNTNSLVGVNLVGENTNVVTFNVVNNVISLTEATTGTNGDIIGIARSGGTGVLFRSYYNTVHIDGVDGTGTGSRANQVIFTGSNSGASITKNNIFSNSFVNGSYSGGSYGTYTHNIVAYASTNTANPAVNFNTDPTTGAVINNSIFFKYGGAINGDPGPTGPSVFFASLTDLTIQNDYQFAIRTAGTNIADYPKDINGDDRQPTGPSMGAYEYIDPSLPVTIASFNARLNNNKVQFNWAVGTEINVNRYEIERLQANGSYLKVAEVAATAATSYVATDNQPLLGTNYYRLKSVDNDGTFGYYKELRNVKLAALGDKSVSVYPNPVVGNTITVSLINYPVGKYNYKIAGVTGNVVKQGQVDNSGKSSVVSLPVGLAKGIYILHLANGENAVQSKLIKN